MEASAARARAARPQVRGGADDVGGAAVIISFMTMSLCNLEARHRRRLHAGCGCAIVGINVGDAGPRTGAVLIEKPYTLYPSEGSPRRHRWWRPPLLALGILVAIAGLVLGGAYAWTSAVLSRAHEDLGPEVFKALTSTTVGVATVTSKPVPAAPEGTLNILVLGSDRRPDDSEPYGRSDTIMIVHLDPDAGFVSTLSLPRDLRVRVSGHGLRKINAAYALGGDALAIQTVREVTGLDFDEYVNVDFEAFRRLTTSLGGIYVDVDHRYYSRDPSYEYVDVLPGYQRLQGDQALQYVRFRHDLNNDFGRIARQQRFLRAVREQALGWSTLARLPQMANLLADNASTTMVAGDIFKLAWWGVKLGSGNVKQVDLTDLREAKIGGGDYVLADEASIREAIDDLLAPPEPSGSRGSPSESGPATTEPVWSMAISAPGSEGAGALDLTSISIDVLDANGRDGEAAATARTLDDLGARIHTVGDAPSGPLGASVIVYPPDATVEAARVSEALGIFKLVEDGSRRRVTVLLGADFVPPEQPTFAAGSPPVPNPTVWRYLAGAAGFPLMAPSVLPPQYRYAGFRLYSLESEGGPADTVKVMYRLGDEDQYLGITETRFMDAPAAADGETVNEGDITLTIVGSGASVDRIWWKRGGVLHWLSNTLSFRLDREEMLRVARSMVAAE